MGGFPFSTTPGQSTANYRSGIASLETVTLYRGSRVLQKAEYQLCKT